MIFRYAMSSFALLVVLAVLLRLTVFSNVVMSGGAMEPAILPGEFLLATRGNASDPPRGAVVVLKCAATKDQTYLKRVVAIAGDRMDSRDHRLFVNEVATEAAFDLNASIIPPEHVYVLNENPGDSDDSRAWGPLPTECVDGRARLIWLSLDWFDDSGNVRSWPKVRWPRMLRFIR